MGRDCTNGGATSGHSQAVLMNKEQAKRALDLLLQKYPNHDIIPQAESFLARL